MDFDPERVRLNARHAETEDLLDRVTVYRSGMEPEALDIIEAELESRGVLAEHIEAHASEREPHVLWLPDGTARSCTFCYRPAVAEGWGWHRIQGSGPFGWVFSLAAAPLAWLGLPIGFPRYCYYCEVHQPAPKPQDDEAA